MSTLSQETQDKGTATERFTDFLDSVINAEGGEEMDPRLRSLVASIGIYVKVGDDGKIGINRAVKPTLSNLQMRPTLRVGTGDPNNVGTVIRPALQGTISLEEGLIVYRKGDLEVVL